MYVKPESELVVSTMLVPLCGSIEEPKGTVNTLFGSDLPEDQFGHEDWVVEGWTDFKKQFDENFEAIEIGGNDDGKVFSR